MVLVCCAYVLLAPAQTLSPGEVRLSSSAYEPKPILRAVSRLVQLEVVVRDSRGRAIPGLTKGDFAVYDSGKIRDLTAFSVDISSPTVGNSSGGGRRPASTSSSLMLPPAAPNLPGQGLANGRWIALLFDDINTASGDLARAKIAASRFIKEAVRGGDSIAIFTTSGTGAVQFTSESTAIFAAISKVESHPRVPPGGVARCPRMTAYEAYQIVRGDPSATKAKAMETCTCTGSGGCPPTMESAPDSDFVDLTPSDPNGNRSIPPPILDAVLAQAQQTWDEAHLASQLTLDGIKSSLGQLARMPGKRMLLLASSGFLSNTLDQEQDSIIDEALHAGVVINSLDAKGLYAEAPGTPLNESVEFVDLPVSTYLFQMRSLGDSLESVDSPLARFAESTGGLLFRNNNDLDLGFRQLGLLPSCIYLLGFTPLVDGKYHKIRVELRSARHDFVQVRPGYFAPQTAPTEEPGPLNKIDALMSGTDEKTDLPATISEKLGTAKSGQPEITIQTHVDIQKLRFEQEKDRQVQKLVFTAALFDSHGNFVTGKQAEMDLALKAENFDRFSKTGISGVMQLEAPAGLYRLRLVVEEAVQGHVSATSKELEVR